MMPRLIVGLTTLGVLGGARMERKTGEELRREMDAATVSAPQDEPKKGVDLSPLFLGGLAGAGAAAGINIGANVIGRRRRKRPETFQEAIKIERREPAIEPSII